MKERKQVKRGTLKRKRRKLERGNYIRQEIDRKRARKR